MAPASMTGSVHRHRSAYRVSLESRLARFFLVSCASSRVVVPLSVGCTAPVALTADFVLSLAAEDGRGEEAGRRPRRLDGAQGAHHERKQQS